MHSCKGFVEIGGWHYTAVGMMIFPTNERCPNPGRGHDMQNDEQTNVETPPEGEATPTPAVEERPQPRRFTSATVPTFRLNSRGEEMDLVVGDQWIDPNNERTIAIWDGTTWVGSPHPDNASTPVDPAAAVDPVEDAAKVDEVVEHDEASDEGTDKDG